MEGVVGSVTAGFVGSVTAGFVGSVTAGFAGSVTAGFVGSLTAGFAGTVTTGFVGVLTFSGPEEHAHNINARIKRMHTCFMRCPFLEWIKYQSCHEESDRRQALISVVYRLVTWMLLRV
jgi:hypothetical protein